MMSEMSGDCGDAKADTVGKAAGCDRKPKAAAFLQARERPAEKRKQLYS